MIEQQRFTIEDWRELAEPSAPGSISLFMPLVRAGREIRQNAIRFKNALGDVERGMAERGLPRSEIAATAAALGQLADSDQFARHQGDGLAVFARDEAVVKWAVVPLRLPQSVVVARRFHLTPLLPLVLGDGVFYVLIVSQSRVALLECTRQGFVPLPIEKVPQGREIIDRYVEEDRGIQAQSVPGAAPSRGRGAVMFHGQGAPEANEKARIFEYFRTVDHALGALLPHERAPVVFAGVEYLFPIYQQANRSLQLMPEFIHGNFDPERADFDGLHTEAWRIVEPEFRGDRQAELALIREAIAKNQGSAELNTIVEAGAAGLIEHMAVNPSVQQWGRFDEMSGRVLEDERRTSSGDDDDEDLINLAAIFAMRGNAAVTIVEDISAAGAGGPAIAASFRAPLRIAHERRAKVVDFRGAS
jgi:hypothetical protein